MRLNLPNNKYFIPAITIIGLGLIVFAVVAFLNSQQASQEKASALFKKGDISGASDAYKKLVNGIGATAEAWNNYGNTLRELKNYSEAMNAYQQAIKLDSKYEAAYRNLTYLAIDWEANDKANGAGKISDAIKIVEDGFNRTGKSLVTLAEDLIALYGKQGNTAKVSEWQAIRTKLLK